MQCPPSAGTVFLGNRMSQDSKKKHAAQAALTYLREGIVLGVGTGSTAEQFIQALSDQQNRLEAVVSI
jgi:ribose 5-phosphate isomerase A